MIQPPRFGLPLKLPVGIALTALVTMGLATALSSGTIPPWLAELCGTHGSAMLSVADGGTGATGRPTTIIKPLSCEALPNVPGKSVTTALLEFPPGAYTGPHHHPGSVTAYVVSGNIRSRMADARAAEYHAGQVWFEAPQALHMYAENASSQKPATLLVTFVADSNCGPLVIPEPTEH